MRRTRSEEALTLVVVAAALALAACGGGSKGESGSTQKAPSATGTATTGTSAASTTGTSTTSTGQTNTDGGGTEPVRAPATLTGHGGRITPTSVHVPPFISVEISLGSADGRTYSLSVAGRMLSVSGAHPTASVTLPGLRPGASYMAKPSGGGPAISITPSAEPGP